MSKTTSQENQFYFNFSRLFQVAIECDKSIYETKLGIVIGTLQLKQTTSSGCSSLVPFLEKASKLGRKSSDVSINSIPSFPTHLSPIEEMEDRPERNDYFVSDKANSIARMAVDHSRSTYLTTSFKTLVLLAIAASFVMPLTGIPAILLASKSFALNFNILNRQARKKLNLQNKSH